MYEYDYEQEPINPFQDKIERMIENEVTRRLSDRIKQAEKDVEYFRAEMWEAKQEISSARKTLDSIEKETDKKIKEAAKIAQREYWFDCAVGDYIYLIDYKYHRRKCERCGGQNRIKVVVDGIEVNADCPVCGTYQKSQKLSWREPYIAGGKVVRLQIELNDYKSWIRIWLDRDEEHKLELEYHKVFRTKEEAESALQEILNSKDDE